jgi:sigma-B regulation protein RsbQ
MTRHAIARNNVHVYGDAPTPMLFAPGFGCDQTMWRFVAPAFADRYKVVLIDYVGTGRSDLQAYDPKRYSDLGGYAQDLLDICAELELNGVIMVGHSISGVIGALASLQEPGRFARLILIGSSACYINHPPDYIGGFERPAVEELLDLMEKNYSGWASFLAPMVMKNAGRPELAAELEASFRMADPAIARQFAALTFGADVRDLLPRITVPSLVLQCMDDMIVPQSAAEYLHSHLAQSTMRPIQAVGHYPHLSNPAETVRLIDEYLRALPLD